MFTSFTLMLEGIGLDILVFDDENLPVGGSTPTWGFRSRYVGVILL